ncbi:MAG: hypothetical protein CL868_12550 [Cytophagaceae bacterium]|nr:hypothetical protein [Cytophagaceae bacterium]|tara:strand:- start:645 stop:869 length:225 start_codon:yes stop_codon:yes gene_type:complete
MKKLIFAGMMLFFALSLNACRESTVEKTNDAAKAIGEDVENAAEEAGDAIKEGADELNDEIQGNDEGMAQDDDM